MIELSVVGQRQVHDMLAQFIDPEMTKRAQRATKAAATKLKPHLREAVRPLSAHMAASVYVHVAKRDKPAYVVGHHDAKAFWWHMVIGGTKDHGPRKAKNLVFIPGWNPYLGVSSHGVGNEVIRTRNVRGIPPHPVVQEVADRYGDEAIQALLDDLTKPS